MYIRKKERMIERWICKGMRGWWPDCCFCCYSAHDDVELLIIMKMDSKVEKYLKNTERNYYYIIS